MRFSVSSAILALTSLAVYTQANPDQDVDNFLSNYERSVENHDRLAGHRPEACQMTCMKKNMRVRKSW
jgi:hypothetical protein